MTTTNDKMRARVIGLVAKARATEFDAERATFMEKAQDLVTKYSLPASLLTDPTPQAPSAARAGRPSYTQPERKYPCRFGCGTYTQHTIDEMNACAERRRNETGSDSAYAETPRRRASGSTFDDLFNSFFRDMGADPRAGSERGRTYTNTPPRARATGSHANCDHPATKSARAHCRKMRSMGL